VPAISELRRTDDDHRAVFLRVVTDDMGERIRRRRITAAEARHWAAGLRFQASLLFPDRMETYDRIYGARLERLIQQFLAQGA
jgi:hypothetical protein